MQARLRLGVPERAVKALEPDNTPQMVIQYLPGQIQLQLQLPKLSSISAVLDDFLMNLEVALKILELCNRYLKARHESDCWDQISASG